MSARRAALRRWTRALLAVGVLVAYNNWLAFPITGVDEPLRGYLSELAADDQPLHWFFRAGDLLAAVLFLLLAAAGWHGWRRLLGRWARWAAVSLGVVGVATILDVTMALPCAESRDPQCVIAGTPIWFLHAATSSSVGLGFFALFLCVAAGLWEMHRRVAYVVVGAGLGIGALNLISGLGPFWVPGIQGAVQPVQVVCCSIFLAILAGILWRSQIGRAH